eukprot:scaffold99089_cov19-Prasinocladus_malaysianus.AAC.1
MGEPFLFWCPVQIQSDLDILETLEPKVNLGSVAKDILEDAQLKEQYAQTMMKTLFMLESAEDSQLKLTSAQCACFSTTDTQSKVIRTLSLLRKLPIQMTNGSQSANSEDIYPGERGYAISSSLCVDDRAKNF